METLEITVWDNIPMVVRFDYEPAQEAIPFGNWAGPGYDSQAIIESVTIGGVEVFEMLTNDQLERIEEKIIRAIED